MTTDQLLATISDLETRHAAVMMHTQAVVDENNKLLATVERLKSALSQKILGKSLRQYMFEQFPATDGHIPFMQFCGKQETVLQSIPSTNLVKRSVLLNAVESLKGKIPLSHDDKLNLNEAREELERTK